MGTTKKSSGLMGRSLKATALEGQSHLFEELDAPRFQGDDEKEDMDDHGGDNDFQEQYREYMRGEANEKDYADEQE